MAISKVFTDGDDRFGVYGTGEYSLEFLDGNDVLATHDGSTTALMGRGDDFVRVYGGSARLYGQDGNDRFDVYASDVRIDGGIGNDLFYIRGGSNLGFAGRAGDDRFNFLSDAIGVRLTGDEGNDLFVGYSHNISGRLFGGDGNDRFLDFGRYDGEAVFLHGGAGNDLYRVDAINPGIVVELAGEGIDTVQLTGEYGEVTYTLGANVENLSAALLSPTWLANLTGNALGNSIIGSAGYDNIMGMAGNDRLHAGAGWDYVDGGDGNDRITGGHGVDYLYGGAGRDLFVYESVADANEVDGWGIPDWIVDWDPSERIDLSGVDANAMIAGNQAFQFAGAYFGEPAPFSGAGTLNIGGFGGDLYITGHTDNDGEIDFIIGVWSAVGESGLTVDNLIL